MSFKLTIDVNFHLQKGLEIFDKNSAYQIWSKKDKEIMYPPPPPLAIFFTFVMDRDDSTMELHLTSHLVESGHCDNRTVRSIFWAELCGQTRGRDGNDRGRSAAAR